MGGSIQILEFFGTQGFAYAGGKLFRTADFGANWVRLDKKRALGSVRNMAMLGPNLYVGTWGGVFRSGDGGETWSPLPQISPVTSVEAMFVHRGELLVLNRANSSLYRYSNSAIPWTRLVISAPNAYISDVKHFAADDSALYIGGKGLFKSLDGGTTWIELMSGLHYIQARSQPRNPSGFVYSLLAGNRGLYAGVEGAVYRSADGGSTWSPLFINGSEYAFSSLALAGDTLLAGNAFDGVWRIPLESSPPSRIEGFPNGVNILRASDSGIFAGTNDGVNRSDDGGKSWSARNFGIRAWSFEILTSQNGVMHAGGGTSRLFRSLDHGATWHPGTGLPQSSWINSLTWSGNTLFASSSHTAIFASEDSGTNWAAHGDDSDSLMFGFLTVWEGTLYAIADDLGNQVQVVIRSDDKGRTWIPAADPIDGGRRRINSVALGGSWIHVGTDSGYYRVDAATGKVDASRLHGELLRKVYALEGLLFASGYDTVLWRSQDQGLTWDKPSVAVPWLNYVSAIAGTGRTVYAGTFGSGVYRSVNGGSSWEPFNTEESDPWVSSLVLDKGRLYAGTSTSIYSLDVGGVGVFSGRGNGVKRSESLLGKVRGFPYLEALQGDGRYRILRLDGRQVADGVIPVR